MTPPFTYRMLLSWSGSDHAWIVEIPDLPGALADGPTPEAAIAQAQDVIAQEEGRPVPQPQHFAMPP